MSITLEQARQRFPAAFLVANVDQVAQISLVFVLTISPEERVTGLSVWGWKPDEEPFRLNPAVIRDVFQLQLQPTSQSDQYVLHIPPLAVECRVLRKGSQWMTVFQFPEAVGVVERVHLLTRLLPKPALTFRIVGHRQTQALRHEVQASSEFTTRLVSIVA